MKKRYLIFLMLLFALMLFSQINKVERTSDVKTKVEKVEKVKARDVNSTADHSKFEVLQQNFENPEDVTKACLTCHTEAAKEIMKTSHWNWERETKKLPGKNGKSIKLGKANVVNNFCIGIESSEPRCTSCHIGYGWKDKTFDFKDETKVDCLVCHEQTGTYKKFPAGAGYPVGGNFGSITGKDEVLFKGNKKTYYKPDYNKVAQSVALPTNKNCGTCHFFGGGGNAIKHGDLDKSLLNADKNIDIHMGINGANMNCIDCHVSDKHDIKGQLYSVSVEDRDRISCERCHTDKPHSGKMFVENYPDRTTKKYKNKLGNDKESETNFMSKLLDNHSKKIACQTCHIPQYATKYKTKMWWDWSKAGQKKDGKGLVKKDKEGYLTYHYKKGEFKMEKNVVPEYYWFNGKAGHILVGDKIDPSKQPIVINPIGGQKNDENSKIWPFKVMRGKQPYDAGNNLMIAPKLFGKKGSGAYWADFDWNKSVAAGMEYVGLKFSGKVGFVETKMYWPVSHMVREKSEALQCDSCHNQEGRLKDLDTNWMPGKDKNKTFDFLGLILILGSFLGVAVHGFLRMVFSKKNGR